MQKYRMKQNDLAPALDIQLLDGGEALDLSQAIGAKFIMRDRTGVKVSAAMSIRDQTQYKGVVRYQWVLGDTDTAGVFDAEVEITWPPNNPQTFPGYQYMKVEISKDLG